MSREGFALAFRTDLSIAEMIDRLNAAVTSWKWIEWQNDHWGDYIRGLATRTGDPSFKLLYDESMQAWAIDVSYEHQSRSEMDELVVSRILPVVNATNVSPMTDDYSS